METMTFDIDQIDELQKPINWIINNSAASIILLKGELGAGKTTFTSAFVKALGVTDAVNSPTFSLVNEYAYRDNEGQLVKIYHIDLYRLNSLEEALNIGIEDYIYSNELCLIEWPDIIETILPENYLTIEIQVTGTNSRKICIFNVSEK